MDIDSRAYLLALTSMNMRVIVELAARTGDKSAARKLMVEFEQSISHYIDHLNIALTPEEGPADLDRLRTNAKGLLHKWMSSFEFEKE